MSNLNQQVDQPGAAYGQQPQPQYGGGFSQTGLTTVIVNQPTPAAAHGAHGGAAPRLWTTGILGCCDDVPICLCGMFCEPFLACQVSTDMGESCAVPYCVPGAEILLRTKWRTQENIQGSILDDCMTVWCCGPLAMCQLAREVQNRKRATVMPIA